MNEEESRPTIRAAFERAHMSPGPGFEARMQTALQAAGPNPAIGRLPHMREGLAILAAVVAAVVVVAALVGPRVFTLLQQTVGVSPPPSLPPLTHSPSPNPNACRLPIVIFYSDTGASPYSAGFLDVATGKFSGAGEVSFADLATVTDGATISATGGVYDPVLKRWLPSTVLSPDQLSYVYVLVKGGKSTLHTFDVVHHTDRVVWTSGDVITASRWKPDGIYAWTDSNSARRYWRIDPLSGKATEINQATFNPYLSLLPGTGSYGTLGSDPDHMIYRIGFQDSKHTYFVIIDGKRTDIYTAAAGDRKDFNPFNVVYDGSLLWFSNVDSKYLWSWTVATGLTRHSARLPSLPYIAKGPAGYWVAGPCI